MIFYISDLQHYDMIMRQTKPLIGSSTEPTA